MIRHCSLPDISTKLTDPRSLKTTEISKDLKALFGSKNNESQYSSNDIYENCSVEGGARAKSLHSDVSEKRSKTSEESSSSSPSNEEIWHLTDGGKEHILKYTANNEDSFTANLIESETFTNDLEKEVSSPHTDSATSSFLEAQRAYLESRIGIESLLKVYRLVAELEEKSVDEKLDYSDFQKILGRGNEDLIDNIIQLVVADNFFNLDQR